MSFFGTLVDHEEIYSDRSPRVSKIVHVRNQILQMPRVQCICDLVNTVPDHFSGVSIIPSTSDHEIHAKRAVAWVYDFWLLIIHSGLCCVAIKLFEAYIKAFRLIDGRETQSCSWWVVTMSNMFKTLDPFCSVRIYGVFCAGSNYVIRIYLIYLMYIWVFPKIMVPPNHPF